MCYSVNISDNNNTDIFSYVAYRLKFNPDNEQPASYLISMIHSNPADTAVFMALLSLMQIFKQSMPPQKFEKQHLVVLRRGCCKETFQL